MKITKIADTRINHGTRPEIIATVTIEHEIAFHPEDVLSVLEEMASDSMAKLINQIGATFNKDQFAECYAADDLSDDGKQFIDDMYYFIHRTEQTAEITRLQAENTLLREDVDHLRTALAIAEARLEMAYCQKIGSDTPNGLSCCDNYRDWLTGLLATRVTDEIRKERG